MKKRAALLLMALLLASCAGQKEKQSRSGVEIFGTKPIVYIEPYSDSYRHYRVGVPSFTLPSNVDPAYGVATAALFKDVLLARRVFGTVKQIERPYRNIADALALAREAGVELVMAGEVRYAIAGTELGGARVAVAVRLISVRSGNTVWYIEQAMDQPMDYPDTSMSAALRRAFAFPETRSSMGAPAVPSMLARIAGDMADILSGRRQLSAL